MKFIKAFLTAALGAVAANLIILYVIGPLVINPALPLHSLSVGPVTVLTLIGAIGATIVYALMRVFLTRPQVPFMWVSLVVLVFSFVPDYLIIGQTTGVFAGGTVSTALTLMLMHVVAAIIIVMSLVRIWGNRPIPAPQLLHRAERRVW
jgi:hypothetical protein